MLPHCSGIVNSRSTLGGSSQSVEDAAGIEEREVIKGGKFMGIGTITVLLVACAVLMFGLVWIELFFVDSGPNNERQYTILDSNEK